MARVKVVEPRRRRWRFAGPALATCAAVGVLLAVAVTVPWPGSATPAPPPPLRVALQSPGEAAAGAPAPREPPRPAPAGAAPAAPVGTTPAEAAAPVPAAPGPRGAGNSFMGVRENYRRVVIAFDVADSVRRKAEQAHMPLQRIRDEAGGLVSRLDGHCAFALIQFVRRYEAFRPQLVPATPANQAEALGWLGKRFHTNGRSGRDWTGGDPDGIELVLQAALAMQPEVLFIISDGDFQRTVGQHGSRDVDWKALEDEVAHWQTVNNRRVRVHVVGIQMEPAQQEAARAFVARFGGQLRLIE